MVEIRDLDFDHDGDVAEEKPEERRFKGTKATSEDTRTKDQDAVGKDGDIDRAKAEKFIKYGYCGSGLSYAFMFCLFAVGHGSRPRFTTFVNIWSALITFLFFITCCMQFTPLGLPKVVLNTMLALLALSLVSLYIFIVVNV